MAVGAAFFDVDTAERLIGETDSGDAPGMTAIAREHRRVAGGNRRPRVGGKRARPMARPGSAKTSFTEKGDWPLPLRWMATISGASSPRRRNLLVLSVPGGERKMRFFGREFLAVCACNRSGLLADRRVRPAFSRPGDASAVQAVAGGRPYQGGRFADARLVRRRVRRRGFHAGWPAARRRGAFEAAVAAAAPGKRMGFIRPL